MIKLAVVNNSKRILYLCDGYSTSDEKVKKLFIKVLGNRKPVIMKVIFESDTSYEMFYSVNGYSNTLTISKSDYKVVNLK